MVRSFALFLLLAACGGVRPIDAGLEPESIESDLREPRVYCHPRQNVTYPGRSMLLRATVSNTDNDAVTWTTSAGRVANDATFTAPSMTGQVTITAKADVNGARGSCVIDVVPEPAGGPAHLALGTPANEVLLEKDLYVVSYSPKHKGPTWVSFELNGSYLGGTARAHPRWRADDTIPAGLPRATDADYDKSGFDRGHLCASADRSRTVEDLEATFILSNAVPQLENVNAGPWKYLENYLQDLAFDGKQIFIIAGALFDDDPPTIGDGVAVPHAIWKVAVIVDRLDARAEDVRNTTEVIAVLMPNDTGVPRDGDWESYRVSVDDIESVSGLDLLSAVDPDVQDVIER